MPTRERTWEKSALRPSRVDPLMNGKSREERTSSLSTLEPSRIPRTFLTCKLSGSHFSLEVLPSFSTHKTSMLWLGPIPPQYTHSIGNAPEEKPMTLI